MAYKIYTYADPYRIRETVLEPGEINHLQSN